MNTDYPTQNAPLLEVGSSLFSEMIFMMKNRPLSVSISIYPWLKRFGCILRRPPDALQWKAPLPNPLPARPSRGEGEDSGACDWGGVRVVVHVADFPVVTAKARLL